MINEKETRQRQKRTNKKSLACVKQLKPLLCKRGIGIYEYDMNFDMNFAFHLISLFVLVLCCLASFVTAALHLTECEDNSELCTLLIELFLYRGFM